MEPTHIFTTLHASDHAIVFWFTHATHSSHRRLNGPATELLLTITGFTAHQVPLLRGNIVITGHDGHGNPAGLSADQMNLLIDSEPTRAQEWTLDRRLSRDAQAMRRARRAADETRTAAVKRTWRV